MFLGQNGDIVILFAFHIDHVISKCRRSSRKEVVHAISLLILPTIWNVEKTLIPEGEKLLVIKEIAKAKTTRSIGERINRCVMTEIGESVRIFGKILQRGNVSLIAVV